MPKSKWSDVEALKASCNDWWENDRRDIPTLHHLYATLGISRQVVDMWRKSENFTEHFDTIKEYKTKIVDELTYQMLESTESSTRKDSRSFMFYLKAIDKEFRDGYQNKDIQKDVAGGVVIQMTNDSPIKMTKEGK